jgi:hypothetical protein
MIPALDASSADGFDAFGAALDAIDVVAALANRILAGGHGCVSNIIAIEFVCQ